MTIAKSPKQLRGVCVAAVLAVSAGRVLPSGRWRRNRRRLRRPAARDLAAEVLRKSGRATIWRLDPVGDRPRPGTRRSGRAADRARLVRGSRSAPGRTPCRGACRRHDRTRVHGGRPDLRQPLGAGGELAAVGARRGPAGAPLVLRGVGEGGLRETVKRIGERLGGAEAGSLPSRLGGRDRLDPGSPSTRACSACSASNGCPRLWWCRAACRRARAGAARTTPPRPTISSPETSASRRRSKPSRKRDRSGAPSPAVISNV